MKSQGQKSRVNSSMSKKERREALKAGERKRRKQKIEEQMRKAKIAKEAYIRNTKERILSGDYTEYQVKTVYFVKEIPVTCDIDGSKLIDVKHTSFYMYGVKVKAHAHCCIRCNSAYLKEEKREEIKEKVDNLKGRPSPLPMANSQGSVTMTEAIKSSAQRVGDESQRLPYEDLPGGVENISRESKVVQVYANKSHCQECENRYGRVTTVNRTAVVDTLDGKTENINVMFCKGCGQYFVSVVTLEQYKTLYGGLLIECRLPPDLMPNQQACFDFAPDSVLSRCGYTVKEGVHQEHRQAVLRYILETSKATKHEIIERINRLISFHEKQSNYYGACQRWKEDIQYVNEYMIDHQKKIYGLEFVPAGNLKKK